MLCGHCPVQAEGTIDGQRFYFRARGTHWSLAIGANLDIDPDWYLKVRYSADPFAAGWMAETEARAIIERCAIEYLASKAKNFKG